MAQSNPQVKTLAELRAAQRAGMERIAESAPAELVKLRQWVCWRLEPKKDRPGGKVTPAKFDKVPLNPQNGRKASSTDPKTWGSFAQALKRFESQETVDGLGFVFTDDAGIVGVDLDGCIDDAGNLAPWAAEIVAQLDTYTELSPSGTGLHMLACGTMPEGAKRRGAVEMYQSGRFFTVTGNRWPGTPAEPQERPAELAEVHAHHIAKPLTVAAPAAVHTQTPAAAHLDDAQLWERMFAGRNGAKIERLFNGDTGDHGGDNSAADLALCNHLAFYTAKDAGRIDAMFRQSKLMRPKWDVRHSGDGDTYGQMTVAAAIAGTVDTYTNGTGPRHANGAGFEGEAPDTLDLEGRADRPPSIYVNRHLSELLDAALEAIQRSNERAPDASRIYVHAGALARIVEAKDAGTAVRALSEGALLDVLAYAARWWKPAGEDGDDKPTKPPREVVTALLHRTRGWGGLPDLDSIIHAPIFTERGELHASPGYDPATRLYYAGAVTLGDTDPTPERVRWALELIFNDYLVDFPFADDASRAHALALYLLPYCRALIDGPTPLHTITAPSHGAGKTWLAQCLLLPALGRAPTATPEARTQEEWGKVITSAVLGAPSYLFFDNLSNILDSSELAAALTTTYWSGRILGASIMASGAIRWAWVATAKNPTLSEETGRRAVLIRLDPDTERPEERTDFRHKFIREWAEEHRGELVTAALVIVRNWLAQGRPMWQGRIKGSYERWTAVMGGILQAAGVPGFLGNEGDLRESATPELAALRAFVARWADIYRESEVTAADLFKLASAPDGGDAQDAAGHENLLGDILGSGNERSRKTKLGTLLNRNRDRVISGWKLRVLGTDRNGVRIYRLEHSTTRPDAHSGAQVAQNYLTARDLGTEVPRVSPEVEATNAGPAGPTSSRARKNFDGGAFFVEEHKNGNAGKIVTAGCNKVPQVPRNGHSPEVEAAGPQSQGPARDELRAALSVWMEGGKPATHAQMLQWTRQARQLGLSLAAGPAAVGGGAGSAANAWTFPNAAEVIAELGPVDVLEELGL